MTPITIHRIADGKLVEKWSEKDVLGFLPRAVARMPPAKMPASGCQDVSETNESRTRPLAMVDDLGPT